MQKSRHITDCGRAKAYTLVELLVAVAILVIMMGFLFQFVIGAQRIWSASEKKANAFDTAQVALDVIETDLHNMQYANDTDAPGATMPFYLWKKSANEIVLAFFADYKSSDFEDGEETKVGTFPVLYYFYKDGTNLGSLYRIALDSKIKFKVEKGGGQSSTITMANLWYLFGADYTNNSDFFGSFLDKAFGSDTTSEENLEQFDVLAENIESFEVNALLEDADKQSSFKPNGNREERYAQSRPKVVKLQLKIDNNLDENKGDMITTNTFTKVIFL